jgi:cell shape-determining protein MreC
VSATSNLLRERFQALRRAKRKAHNQATKVNQLEQENRKLRAEVEAVRDEYCPLCTLAQQNADLRKKLEKK